MKFFNILVYTFAFNLLYFNIAAQSTDSTEYYNLWDEIDAFYNTGQINDVKRSCDELIDYCRENYGENSLETLDALSFKGILLMGNAEYPEAEKLIQKVLENVEIHHGKDNVVYASTLSCYSDILAATGHTMKALNIGKEVLYIDSLLGQENSEGHSIALNNLAVKYQELGKPAIALEYLNKALPLTSESSLPYRYENIAENHKDLGNFREAFEYFEKANALYLENWGPYHRDVLNCQINYCKLRMALGEYDRVIGILSELEQKALHNSDINKFHELHARIQRHLFMAYLNSANYPLAEKYLQKYIHTCETLYNQYPDFINIARIQKIKLLEHQGKLEEADRLLNQILNETNTSISFVYKLQLQNQYISTKTLIKNYKDAISAQQRLNTELLEKLGENNLLYTNGIANLSKLYFENENYGQSRKLNHTLMEGLMGQITSIYPYLSDNGKILFKERTRPIVNFIHRTLVSHFHDSPRYLEKVNEFLINYTALSFSYSNLKRRNDWSEANRDLYTQWMETRNTIEKIYSDPTSYSESLDSLLSLSNELELKLSINNEITYPNTSYSYFRQFIPEKESVIQFFTFPETNGQQFYYALINNHHYPGPVFIPFSDIIPDSLENSTYFTNNFWKKITPFISASQSLSIVPDARIYLAPFYSIRSGEGRDYLFESYDLRIVPDLKSMYFHSSKPNYPNFPKGISIFGNPDYSLVLENEHPRLSGVGLNALPATKKEIDAVRKTFSDIGWESHLYEARQANKIKLSQTAENPISILHIASHGSFTPPQSLINSQETSSLEKFPAVNPMFYSGIHLSASKEANNNGYISAFEISNMKFKDLQLVTLSSCESGLGQSYEGEGVFGIRRAFFLAGAQNIISTIRKIPDGATFVFMKNLYENLTYSTSLFDAFKKTQMYMKDRYPPEVWSAFVLMGNGDFSLSTTSRSQNLRWCIALFIILSIPAVYFLRSRNKSLARSERK